MKEDSSPPLGVFEYFSIKLDIASKRINSNASDIYQCYITRNQDDLNY